MSFAKLFGTDDNQILVVLDAHDETDAPQIKVSWQPEGLGVCHWGVDFPGNDAGEKSARLMFDAMTEDKARELITKTSGVFGVDDLASLTGHVIAQA